LHRSWLELLRLLRHTQRLQWQKLLRPVLLHWLQVSCLLLAHNCALTMGLGGSDVPAHPVARPALQTKRHRREDADTITVVAQIEQQVSASQ